MLLFYIRHGDPIYTPDQLTPLGKRQAEAVAKRLALFGVSKIYSSTSTRAFQTAAPTAELLKLPITQLHWCSEKLAGKDFMLRGEDGINHWPFYYGHIKELFNTDEMRALGQKWYEHPALSDDRERVQNGYERIAKETYAFLASLGYEHDETAHCYTATRPNDDRIALFAHQGFGMTFMSALLDIPYPMYCTHFDMGHSGMTVIEFQHQEGRKTVPCVLQLSNDSHLYREGLPTNYQNRLRF